MRIRYIIVLLFFLVCFLAIWLRLAYWQIVKAEELSAMGQAQYTKHLEIQPKRGEIQTSDGFPFITNKLSYLLYANPQVIKNPEKLATVLSPILSIDVASISAKLATDKLWISLQANLDYETKEKITNIQINGIKVEDNGLGFQETSTRYYPEASLAAQLVGFVGKDTLGQDKGYFGLEGFYDRQLRGRIGKTTILRDAKGNPILAKLTENSGQKNGRTLVLHIDRNIQYLTEKKLLAGIEKYGAKNGLAIVMNPKTGGILAMANFPAFDPREYWKYDQSLYKNPIISDTYEPGSTFKPLVMSAAFDLGFLKPTSTCPICDKPVQIGDYAIHTWNDTYARNITMIDTIIHSDNTSMVYVGKTIGLDNMLQYFKRFGIGQQTGIDLQGEFSPDIKPKEQWYPVDLATASFGQGITVTPIELLDGFCSIANNGIRMEPHIVAKIKTPEGEEIPIPPKKINQPISPVTAKVMTEILVNTVNKGEANFTRLQGYRIAGKTGTASIAKDGHYDKEKTIASFIGFGPAEDPKYCMLVVLHEPVTSIYGAETAAPIFFDISRDILGHYGIMPGEE